MMISTVLYRLPPDKHRFQLIAFGLVKRSIANACQPSADHLVRQCYS